MTGTVCALRRHPIKAHGRETLTHVDLTVGQTIPWDRTWAVALDRAKIEDGVWSACGNFHRAAKNPALMPLTSQTDDEGRITVAHPDLYPLTFDPATEGQAFIDWLSPLVPADGARPARLISAGSRGMTDTDFPSISLNNMSSLRALGQKLGRELEPDRFRGNIWFEGLGPWEEFEWVGRRLSLGTAVLDVKERIGRCKATMVNLSTGRRDADTLGALEEGWGHADFGVYAVVSQSGTIRIGDEVGVT